MLHEKPTLSTSSVPEGGDFSEVWPHSSRQRHERGIGLRAPTRCFAMLIAGPHVARCHAVEFSPSGVVIDRGRKLSEREQGLMFKLELYLPVRPQVVVRALVKVARQLSGTRYALRFVMISDVDRLTLMEHLDREQAQSLRLLSEVEGAA
jgi:hypothetical protein